MSALSGFLSDTLIKGHLSIDRVTFLVFSPRLSLWGAEADCNRIYVDKMVKLTHSLLSENFDPDFCQGIPSDLFRHHFRTSEGVDIQFGSCMPKRKKITDESYILAFGSSEDKENGYIYRYSPNEYAFRIEFNPNTCGLDSVIPLLKYVSGSGITASLIRVARLDIAVDYATDINPALAFSDRFRKSFIAVGQSGIETVYFGSRSSKFYIRLYNKAVELREKQHQDFTGSLWRFELESKASFALDQVPDFGSVFQRFSFFQGGLKLDDWKLNLLLAYAKDYGLKSALSFLPESTAKRYKKLISDLDSNQCIEPVADVYFREFENCFSLVRAEILDALGFQLEK